MNICKHCYGVILVEMEYPLGHVALIKCKSCSHHWVEEHGIEELWQCGKCICGSDGDTVSSGIIAVDGIHYMIWADVGTILAWDEETI